MTALATELELIPGGFPAAQKPAFEKERAALVAEKKALDGQVAHYNRQCAKPEAYQAHKCNVDRQALFKMLDSYNLKVQNFNKRLATVDKGLDKQHKGKDDGESDVDRPASNISQK
jgi:hypothetical protein